MNFISSLPPALDNIPMLAANDDFSILYLTNPENMYSNNPYSQIYKSIDGGINYNFIYQYDGISPINTNDNGSFVIVYNSSSLFTSYDYGLTWNVISLNLNGNIMTMAIYNEKIVLVVCYLQSFLYISQDYGSTFITRSLNYCPSYVNIDANSVISYGYEYFFYISNNLGKSWNITTFSMSNNVNKFVTSNDSQYIYIPSQFTPQLMFSNNMGKSWNYYNLPESSFIIASVSCSQNGKFVNMVLQDTFNISSLTMYSSDFGQTFSTSPKMFYNFTLSQSISSNSGELVQIVGYYYEYNIFDRTSTYTSSLYNSDNYGATFYIPGSNCYSALNCPEFEYCAIIPQYDNEFGSICTSCRYPHIALPFIISPTNIPNICQAINLQVPLIFVYSFIGVLSVIIIFIICFTTENYNYKFAIFIVILPILNISSDFLFLMLGDFYSMEYFLGCSICVLLPNIYFAYYLYREEIDYTFHIQLNCVKSYSDILIERYKNINLTFYETEYSFIFFFYLIQDTLIYISKKTFYLILLLPWLIPNSLIIIPLFIIGSFLYVTKLINVRKINNIFYRLWMGNTLQYTSRKIDSKHYNEGLLVVMTLQSIPLLIIQTRNGILLQEFTIISLISIIISSIIIIDTSYIFIYFYVYHDVKIEHIAILGGENSSKIDLSSEEVKNRSFSLAKIWNFDINEFKALKEENKNLKKEIEKLKKLQPIEV